MKILFYLQNGRLIDYYTSDGDYVSFLKNKEVDGYYLFGVADLPKSWEVDKDFTIITEGYEGAHANGYNICVKLDKLNPLRREVISSIDRQTHNKILQGFEYKGKRFSSSVNAQNKWSNWYISRDFLFYPFYIFNIDDTYQYKVKNAEELAEMYMAMTNTIKACLDVGQNLKKQVKSAKSKKKLMELVQDLGYREASRIKRLFN